MLLNSPRGTGQPGSPQCCPASAALSRPCPAAPSAGFLGTRFLSRWDQAALCEGACPCVLPGTESLVRKDGPVPGLTQALGAGKPGSA